jgi:hypothetical protein
MWKIIIGFVALSAVAIFVMLQGGHIEMGGEHAGQEAMQKESAPADKKH